MNKTLTPSMADSDRVCMPLMCRRPSSCLCTTRTTAAVTTTLNDSDSSMGAKKNHFASESLSTQQ